MADGVDDLPALLELMPQLDVILSGDGIVARRTGGMDFMANGAGTITMLEVLFRDHSIWSIEFEPRHVATGDTITLDGNAPSKIAAMIYEVIERGALLGQS